MKSFKIHGKPLFGHKKWVTNISWRPAHIDASETFFVSASKDFSIRVWNARKSEVVSFYRKHTSAVT